MRIIPAVLAVLLAAGATQAQVKESPIPRIVKKDGRFALLVDDAPFLMLGAQTHNSSAWPGMLPKVWPAMEYMNVNTVEMPVYWEQFEPRQGQYDYTVIDALLAGARQHRLRLVLLWFGTWKNGSQHYMPEWMKLDPVRYPHMVNKNGRAVDSPSPYAAASLAADKTAFTAFMRHLKAVDPQRTVIMVQVENEPGTWGSVRDYSPTAQTLFEAPVPPEVLAAMQVKSASPSPNWQEAFGPEAEVCFHAWSVAKYIGEIAAAGKAVYPLPLYANAALRDPIKPGAPGTYESGGPTDNVLPIYKVAAPALDVLSPDIYMSDSTAYLKVLDLYHRDDNPLFVPETGSSAGVARFFFSALGREAIGFSPFGMDCDLPPDRPDDAGDRAPQFRGQAQGRGRGHGSDQRKPAVRILERRGVVWSAPEQPPRGQPGTDGTRAGGPAQRQSVPGHRALQPRGLPAGRLESAAAVPEGRRGNLRERCLQVPPHLERRRNGLGDQLRPGAGGAARLGRHLLAWSLGSRREAAAIAPPARSAARTGSRPETA
jgi:hypothetical protein